MSMTLSSKMMKEVETRDGVLPAMIQTVAAAMKKMKSMIPAAAAQTVTAGTTITGAVRIAALPLPVIHVMTDVPPGTPIMTRMTTAEKTGNAMKTEDLHLQAVAVLNMITKMIAAVLMDAVTALTDAVTASVNVMKTDSLLLQGVAVPLILMMMTTAAALTDAVVISVVMKKDVSLLPAAVVPTAMAVALLMEEAEAQMEEVVPARVLQADAPLLPAQEAALPVADHQADAVPPAEAPAAAAVQLLLPAVQAAADLPLQAADQKQAAAEAALPEAAEANKNIFQRSYIMNNQLKADEICPPSLIFST